VREKVSQRKGEIFSFRERLKESYRMRVEVKRERGVEKENEKNEYVTA
jgi:hypothetical protein